MVAAGRKYVFDFDSTLTRVEALDVLAEITPVSYTHLTLPTKRIV